MKIFPRFIFFILIAVLGIILYSNTFQASFQFDDQQYIVRNTGIRDVSDIAQIWNALKDPLRFVGLYSFAWNYHFHQLDVFGYHVVNILIHVISSLLVGWLVMLILALPVFKSDSLGEHKERIAFWATLFFLAHPVQIQAVTYITQRFASLATLFYVLTVCLYLKGRMELSKQGVYFTFAALAAILGMFTKQITLTLPLMILLVEFLCLKGNRQSHWTFFILLFVFLLIIPAVYSFNVAGILAMTTLSDSHQGDIITSGNYFLTQFRVVLTYLRLLVIPIGQNLDYDFPVSRHFWEISTFLSFMGLLFLFCGAVKLINRRRFIVLGMFWFFLTLSVESGVIPIRNVIFEHRLYLPSVGFFAGLSAGLYYLIKDKQKYVIICAIIVCTFSYLTFQRNKVWQDPVSLWTDVVKKSPYKARAHYNLGLGYYHRGDYKKALNYYNQAVALRPQYFAVFNNRGLLYRKVGNNKLAMADFNRALELNHDTVAAAEVYHNRGVLYRQQQQYEQALTDFNRALALNQNLAQPYISRAIIFAIKSQYDLALNDLEKAETLNSHLEDIYSNRGNIYRRQGHYDLALDEFAKALAINPGFATPYYLRSLVYADKGDIQQALEDALKAKSLGKKIGEDYIKQLQMSFDRIQ